MEEVSFGRVPFLAAVVIVGAISLGVVALGLALKLGVYSLALLAIPIAVAAYYLSEYSERPYASRSPPESSDEPFDDPVEEADRLATEAARQDGEPSPPVVESGAEVDATPAPPPVG